MRELEVTRGVSSALVRLVQGLCVRPDYVIGRGGITLSNVDRHAPGVRRALVSG